MDANISSSSKYKGKYSLYFDWWERSVKFKLKFSDNENKNLDVSVNHKGKLNHYLIDKYSVYYSVDINQKLVT